MQILVVGSETRVRNATECIIAVQGHLRVNQGRWFWYQLKARIRFRIRYVLVIYSNLCRISHRFGDTAAYWSKIANSYPPHPHSTHSVGVTPFEFLGWTWYLQKLEWCNGDMLTWHDMTRPMVDNLRTWCRWWPCGEEIMILGRTMWTQSTSVTDRRTHRITMTKTVQRIASHGKNCSLA